VRNADAGLGVRFVGPQGCGAAAGPLGKRAVGRIERLAGSAPFRPCGARSSPDKIEETVRLSPRRSGERSNSAARTVWLSGSIRQKIISESNRQTPAFDPTISFSWCSLFTSVHWPLCVCCMIVAWFVFSDLSAQHVHRVDLHLGNRLNVRFLSNLNVRVPQNRLDIAIWHG
jgi:hypothetical protein